ncbi:MAG: cytosolic protein, partial [Planctomycetes bacterium]|nr:cytosolic protein [Planctomycetota bacterium]
MNDIKKLLSGAYDIHVHCAPDTVPRSENLNSLFMSANEAGLAGIVIKDHNTSTVGRVMALNTLVTSSCVFYAALALNHAVGGINPAAARAALRAGTSIIYMPTNSSAHQYCLG